MKTYYPRLLLVEYLGDERIRLSFSVGRFVEVKEMTLRGVRSNVRIVDRGLGLDPGDGLDRSATTIYDAPGKWLRKRPDHDALVAANRAAMRTLSA